MERSGPFARLDEARLRTLAPGGAVRAYPRSTVVVNEGDATDSLYIVLSGRVKAFVGDESGREAVVNIIERGDYFGELVLDGGPRGASVMTLEPSRFYVIRRAEVEILLKRDPEFARDLIDKLIGKVRALTRKVSDLTMKDVYGRFVRFVEERAVQQDGRRLVPEPLTQHDIGARIGGSRETVARILKDLSVGGYISIDAKRIVVHKSLPAHW